MAIVRVAPFLIAEWLFKGLDVRITGGGWRPSNAAENHGWFEFEIEGENVPDCKEVRVICTQYNNPGADPFTTVEIQALPDQPQELGEHPIG